MTEHRIPISIDGDGRVTGMGTAAPAQHGPFFHVTQEEKDTCEVCERQRLSDVGAQSSTVALREALAEALAVIADCVGYSHSGDPWEENAFDMGELDIHDYARDGRLERAKALLAAQPPATTAAVPGCATLNMAVFVAQLRDRANHARSEHTGTADADAWHFDKAAEVIDNLLATPSSAAPSREAIARAIFPNAFLDEDEKSPPIRLWTQAMQDAAFETADAVLALFGQDRPPAAPVETTRLDVAKAIDPGAAWGMAVERDSPANERILQALAKADAALAVSRSSTGAAANRHLIDFISEKIGLPHNEEPSCDNFLAWFVAGEPQKARLFLKISSAIYQLNRAEQSTTDEVVRRHLREIITWLKEE